MKALFKASVFELRPLTGTMDTMRWRLLAAFPQRMHVLLACNIENYYHGT